MKIISLQNPFVLSCYKCNKISTFQITKMNSQKFRRQYEKKKKRKKKKKKENQK